ncbi:general stress protein [Paenibacillus arenilitoris]|uniref:General stress protein n=1 Tax=Paenibacillus arenilitoris TaxID=2772299 RepID=A0A927HA79_9BACL|nr:general stress protein [Paenibacillus arenilitoris]MBD2872359.1 general stress protein [Paenibacillus arenilitoris]
MAKKIGVFETERQAIEAVRQLEQAGFVQGELQVLAKDSEHSRRIEAESGVHADELRELAETSDGTRGIGNLNTMAAAGFGGLGAAAAYGISGYGTAALIGGTYPLAAAALTDDDYGFRGVLQSLGLGEEEAQLCYEELRSGSVIVIARNDESKTLLDTDGPDLSRLSEAEGIFRQCDAKTIATGA